MKNKTWDSENFKRDSKLIDKLYNSPIYNPTHKQTIINPEYKDWEEYKDSKWIYEGFLERFQSWFSAREYLEPWVIERTKNHEGQLSWHAGVPTFGAEYILYFNSVRVGTLTVEAELPPAFPTDEERAKREINYYANIHRPELLPHETIKTLNEFLNRHNQDKNSSAMNFLNQMACYKWEQERGADNEYLIIHGKDEFTQNWLEEQNLLSKTIK